MPERRLDEDDPNWVLANHGRGSSKRRPKPPPEINEDEAERSRNDIRAVYERLGLTPPGEDEEEAPDAWRDDWREVRGWNPRVEKSRPRPQDLRGRRFGQEPL